VPKKELHRFHVQVPLLSRKQRGRKLVIRLVQDTKVSTLEKSREDSKRPSSSSLVPTQRRRRSGRALQWSILWLSILSLLGVTVASGVLLLTQLPPPINCRESSPLSADGDRLYCAQLAAQSGKLESLVAAVTLVQDWPSNHPLYSEAQRLLEKWSEDILEMAQQKVNQGKYSEAATIASKVPVSSPLYPEAQADIATWQQEWRRGEEMISQFKDALKVQNWSRASGLIAALSKSNREYWSVSRVDSLVRQLEAEKQAWQQLKDALDLAKSNKLAQLEEAIALAAKINPNSYIKAQAQVEQSRWSRTLLKLAAMYFENQDFAGVVNVLKGIPVNTTQYSEAQDWIRLARASQTAGKDNVLALLDALATVHQIAPKSPLDNLATTKATLWQSQLQNHAQLQFAALLASVDQRITLTYAIDQARQVAPGHPKRLLAQTLIAQWSKEIQQIEDRNKLQMAQQLAERGTSQDLKAAVEIASKIQLGQPLRLEAQNAIAKWNRQIQTITDQPILDLARALAQRQDLIGAISTAQQIRPGQALYREAQQAISDWVAQVQTAQDRPILEAAAALAAQGRFDAAIATVSQIPPQRALYKQAQALKSSWILQKATIRGIDPAVVPTPN